LAVLIVSGRKKKITMLHRTVAPPKIFKILVADSASNRIGIAYKKHPLPWVKRSYNLANTKC
jgi:hypothetical protein